MRIMTLLVLIAFAGVTGGCATPAPKELVDARKTYLRASHGPAAQVAPAELHIAHLALTKAESSFEADPDSYRVRDLAYVAERKAQLAEAKASIINEKESQVHSNADFQNTQANIAAKTEKSLSEANTALVNSDAALANSDAALARSDAALVKADAALAKSEKETAAALEALAKLAAVKEEERGVVITLSGSVLFASNKSILLPEAKTRLDQVSEVLLSTRERNLVVEGHTDSEGSLSDNMELSQRRADAVGSYLVSRGYSLDLIRTVGMGEGHPIADNDSPEGRANNRRVEIIIERDSTVSGR